MSETDSIGRGIGDTGSTICIRCREKPDVALDRDPILGVLRAGKGVTVGAFRRDPLKDISSWTTQVVQARCRRPAYPSRP